MPHTFSTPSALLYYSYTIVLNWSTTVPRTCPFAYLLQAADAGMKHVRICECIAAGCHGGASCTLSHPALHECVPTVFKAAQELVQLKRRERAASLCKAIAVYVPHMLVIYR